MPKLELYRISLTNNVFSAQFLPQNTSIKNTAVFVAVASASFEMAAKESNFFKFIWYFESGISVYSLLQ